MVDGSTTGAEGGATGVVVLGSTPWAFAGKALSAKSEESAAKDIRRRFVSLVGLDFWGLRFDI